MPLTFGQALTVLLVNVLGVLPFCAMGLFVGSLVSGQAAPAIVNLIYIPDVLPVGRVGPDEGMPKALHQLAPLWPAHHLVQLGLGVVGAPDRGLDRRTTWRAGRRHRAVLSLAMRRLSNRGFQLLGAPRGGGIGCRCGACSPWGSCRIAIGLVIAGVMGGNAPQASADTAATSNDATDGNSATAATDAAAPSGAPVGVAAPDNAADRRFRPGQCKRQLWPGLATQAVTTCAAATRTPRNTSSRVEHRSRARRLEVTGEVGTAIQYPFAGTSFLPNGTDNADFGKQGYMDYSAKQTR